MAAACSLYLSLSLPSFAFALVFLPSLLSLVHKSFTYPGMCIVRELTVKSFKKKTKKRGVGGWMRCDCCELVAVAGPWFGWLVVSACCSVLYCVVCAGAVAGACAGVCVRVCACLRQLLPLSIRWRSWLALGGQWPHERLHHAVALQRG